MFDESNFGKVWNPFHWPFHCRLQCCVDIHTVISWCSHPLRSFCVVYSVQQKLSTATGGSSFQFILKSAVKGLRRLGCTATLERSWVKPREEITIYATLILLGKHSAKIEVKAEYNDWPRGHPPSLCNLFTQGWGLLKFRCIYGEKLSHLILYPPNLLFGEGGSHFSQFWGSFVKADWPRGHPPSLCNLFTQGWGR